MGWSRLLISSRDTAMPTRAEITRLAADLMLAAWVARAAVVALDHELAAMAHQ